MIHYAYWPKLNKFELTLENNLPSRRPSLRDTDPTGKLSTATASSAGSVKVTGSSTAPKGEYGKDTGVLL